MNPDGPTALARDAGISISYASQILSGKRAPSFDLALAIFRRTGRAFGPLAGLGPDALAALADRAPAGAA